MAAPPPVRAVLAMVGPTPAVPATPSRPRVVIRALLIAAAIFAGLLMALGNTAGFITGFLMLLGVVAVAMLDDGKGDDW